MWRIMDKTDEKLSRLDDKLGKIAMDMEKLQIAEYIELLKRPRKFLYINFIAGITRGFGMAIGFTILGGITFYILTKLAVLNIPVIGNYITEIVKFVQDKL